MKKIYLILILSLILLLLLHRCKEHFDVVSDVVYPNSYHDYKSVTDTSPPSYESDLSFTSSPTMNCCLISKEYVEDPSGLYNGTFKYKYKKLTDDMCNPQLYNLDSNKQLFIEGDNNWTNLSCADLSKPTPMPKTETFINITPSPELSYYYDIVNEIDAEQAFNLDPNNNPPTKPPPKAQILGSCRFANKECFDYVNKKFCDRFNMDWSTKTCNEMLEYKFIDKVKNHIPTFDYDDSIINLFPQPGV